MKAAVLTQLGTTPLLQNIDDPHPENDRQQMIRVKAAPLKTLDKLMTMESFYACYSDLPAIVGTDGVGILEDGRRVYGQGITGMFAEKAVIPTNNYVVLPDNLDFATAAALPNAVQGSVLPLRLRGDIQQGDTVLINGATGFTGQLAVQAARHYGATRIIATGRSEERLQQLNKLGAQETISLTQSDEDISKQLKQVVSESPIDIVIDYLWGHPADLLIEALQNGPTHSVRFINVGNMAGSNIALGAGILRGSAIELLGSGLGSYTEEEFTRLTTEFLPEMFQLAAKEKLTITTVPEPLDNIEQVWNRETEAGKRLVITLA
ncbi:MAG TPA: zinc-binding alcohol dehydrogenase family protein [Fodinibius sp.]|nr:zinc-binding alcohol dehydrogenase family protein [Fodinibius sp.]